MTIGDFKSALTAGLDNQHDGLSQNAPSYRRVVVLTFSWMHIQTTFSIDVSDLLIVYYFGSSSSYGQGNDKQVYLEPRWRSPPAAHSHISPCIIDFTRVQRECVNQSSGDILLLMDCPSFPSRLDNILRSVATDGHVLNSQHLNSQHLYARLATEAIMSTADGGERMPLPIHVQHRAQLRKSIFLAPPAVSGPSNWVGVRLGPACFQHVSVVLTVRLRDADRETTGQLRRWLERSPSDGDGRLEIHQPSYFFRGEVVLFKVTLDVWCSLRGYPAITFVSFEQRTRPSAGPGLAPAPALVRTGGPVITGGVPPFAEALWGGNR
ncbi:hypothetical protein CPLU01_10038 [Colletotrichum plurivorum]|uniref:Uncharacterized protein n=1 Tax=Colletotrichum plurivorum TaxID=2175906 RepID=A0A8H6NAW6_9PEZI|nr:hypothetical protein CPLU01_10038 [Colletotrichum plurivorum]